MPVDIKNKEAENCIRCFQSFFQTSAEHWTSIQLHSEFLFVLQCSRAQIELLLDRSPTSIKKKQINRLMNLSSSSALLCFIFCCYHYFKLFEVQIKSTSNTNYKLANRYKILSGSDIKHVKKIFLKNNPCFLALLKLCKE